MYEDKKLRESMEQQHDDVECSLPTTSRSAHAAPVAQVDVSVYLNRIQQLQDELAESQ